MRNESKPGRPATGVAANDNGGAEAGVQSAILTFARLLGRQIARERFSRSHAATTAGRPAVPGNGRPDGSDNMTRAALYARYSSDQQRAASIDDQFRVCREHAERHGWTVAGGYRDAAASGASVILRPGLQALLEDARRGAFDVMVAVALDRVSRDQADVAALYKHLQLAGVMIVTLAEGEISELHVGLKGTMNALYLKDPRGEDPPRAPGPRGAGPLGRRALLRLRRGEGGGRRGRAGPGGAHDQRGRSGNRAPGVPRLRGRGQPARDRAAAQRRGRPPARRASSGTIPPSGGTRSAARGSSTTSSTSAA